MMLRECQSSFPGSASSAGPTGKVPGGRQAPQPARHNHSVASDLPHRDAADVTEAASTSTGDLAAALIPSVIDDDVAAHGEGT